MKRVTQKQYVSLLRRRFKREFGESSPIVKASEWNIYSEDYKIGATVECDSPEVFVRAAEIVMKTRGLYISGEADGYTYTGATVYQSFHPLCIELTCQPTIDLGAWTGFLGTRTIELVI